MSTRDYVKAWVCLYVVSRKVETYRTRNAHLKSKTVKGVQREGKRRRTVKDVQKISRAEIVESDIENVAKRLCETLGVFLWKSRTRIAHLKLILKVALGALCERHRILIGGAPLVQTIAVHPLARASVHSMKHRASF